METFKKDLERELLRAIKAMGMPIVFTSEAFRYNKEKQKPLLDALNDLVESGRLMADWYLSDDGVIGVSVWEPTPRDIAKRRRDAQ